jgi:hypothetical protein
MTSLSWLIVLHDVLALNLSTIVGEHWPMMIAKTCPLRRSRRFVALTKLLYSSFHFSTYMRVASAVRSDGVAIREKASTSGSMAVLNSAASRRLLLTYSAISLVVFTKESNPPFPVSVSYVCSLISEHLPAYETGANGGCFLFFLPLLRTSGIMPLLSEGGLPREPTYVRVILVPEFPSAERRQRVADNKKKAPFNNS